MRIYISGAVTGNPIAEENFNKAKVHLVNEFEGCEIINPFNVCQELTKCADLSHGEIMEICFGMLDMCEAIYMIPGWEFSRGANQEYGYARGRKKTIFIGRYEDLE